MLQAFNRTAAEVLSVTFRFDKFLAIVLHKASRREQDEQLRSPQTAECVMKSSCREPTSILTPLFIMSCVL